EALRQLEFQVLETGATDGPAEAHYGGLADAHFAGQVGHGRMHHLGGVGEDVVGDLQLRFSENLAVTGNVLEQVHVSFMIVCGTGVVVSCSYTTKTLRPLFRGEQ